MFNVIKHTIDGTLVFPYHLEDINPESQFIVEESQEAFLYFNNQLRDCFASGKYKFGSVVNFPSDMETTVIPVIFFVNKTKESDMRWGVSKVDFTEPEFGVLLNIGAHGNLTFTIADTKVFLNKFIISNNLLTQDKFLEFTREFIFSNIKLLLTETVNSCKDIELTTIESQLDILTDLLKAKLTKIFTNYGLQVVDFVVLGVRIDENHPGFKQFIEKKQKTFPSHPPIDFPEISIYPVVQTIENTDGFNLGKNIAENEGASMGLGLGIGVAASAFSCAYNETDNGVAISVTPSVQGNMPAKSQKDKLLELKELFDKEFITEKEYNARKIEILTEN